MPGETGFVAAGHECASKQLASCRDSTQSFCQQSSAWRKGRSQEGAAEEEAEAQAGSMTERLQRRSADNAVAELPGAAVGGR